MPAKKPAATSAPEPGSLEEWRHRSVMRDVTLPSGMQVDLRAVPIDELAAVEGLPLALQRVALLHASGGFETTLAEMVVREDGEHAGTRLLEDNRQLFCRLVRLAVVGPRPVVDALAALPEDDPLEGIDEFDKRMIAEIAQRLISQDAAGRRVYGAQPLATFPGADRER